MTITDAELIGRIDASIAVQRALTAAEEGAFRQFVLVGQFDGATIADWISIARDADAFIAVTEKWWRRAGDAAVAYLAARHELPEDLIRDLLGAALYATCGYASATLAEEPWSTTVRRTHIEIASGAALWVRGYAEALGWEPHRGTV